MIDIGGKVRDGIKAGYQTVRNCLLLAIVDRAVNTPLPIIGRSARDIANVASDGLDTATDIRNPIFGRPG